MSRISTTFVGILIGGAALLAIAGHIGPYPWLVYTFKPLATLLIIGIALSNWISQKRNYALWITAGLVFSLVGDILLMWLERFFVAGLGAFLLAHIAYLAAFMGGVKFPASWTAWIIYLAIGVGVFFVLDARLPAGLKAPVAVYAFALATMAAQAMGRYLWLRTGAALLAAVGALFFMVSDGLLATDRFRAAIPYAAVVVLVPYYIAQMLIALSTQRAD
jgi:alkylglycerol monooxygenase